MNIFEKKISNEKERLIRRSIEHKHNHGLVNNIDIESRFTNYSKGIEYNIE